MLREGGTFQGFLLQRTEEALLQKLLQGGRGTSVEISTLFQAQHPEDYRPQLWRQEPETQACGPLPQAPLPQKPFQGDPGLQGTLARSSNAHAAPSWGAKAAAARGRRSVRSAWPREPPLCEAQAPLGPLSPGNPAPEMHQLGDSSRRPGWDGRAQKAG